MPRHQQLQHPFAYHAQSYLRIPFPPGTPLVNLRDEPHKTPKCADRVTLMNRLSSMEALDEDQRPIPCSAHFATLTPINSLWIVESVYGDQRRLRCPESCATITSTVERLRTEFTASLLGWHYCTGKGILHTVIAETSLRHPMVTVRRELGDIFPLHRDQVLRVLHPPNMKWSYKAQGYIPILATDPVAAPVITRPLGSFVGPRHTTVKVRKS
jgi:hypothetical protein